MKELRWSNDTKFIEFFVQSKVKMNCQTQQIDDLMFKNEW